VHIRGTKLSASQPPARLAKRPKHCRRHNGRHAAKLARRVALDFSDVTYIDSTIIHELVRLHNARAVAEFERETIVLRSANLLKVFWNAFSLASIFRIVGSSDEAIAKDGEHITVRYASAFDSVAQPTAPH
jgi:hypothetical protein